ncbi:FtsX-like permease family protein [Anaerovorax odorimutans]|uniref:FtsX-like permease family protein n=1 Tax=Anaerovorax odorimutans TaxID=109327 RepID=A0ABT1RJ62_9FIRM|nr:FtsX-like permease family protein [Anaerovorax odorimutans]MCQ4635222.1 FtsX-like permease family protein [Anaerovorax odorimutans]
MKRNYIRTITREIKQSFGRFAAIIAIVALGVGFLVGILSATPDMKASVDQYYRGSSMSDFNIKSTMGLTDEDVSALAALPQTDRVMPAYATDVLMSTGEDEVLAGRLYGLDLSKNNSASFVNDLTLLKGRMPENAGECVIENPNDYMSQLTIGDTLSLSKDGEDLSDTYRQQSFTIVGIVSSPYYFCNSKEPASAGNGRAGAIVYADSRAYKLDAYTDIFLTLKNQGSSFSDAYKSRIEAASDDIEDLSRVRIEARYNEVVSEAEDKLNDAREKLDKEKRKSEKQLADARKEIDQGQKELDSGSAQLKKAKEQLKSGKAQLKSGKAEFKSGKAQLEDAKAQLKSGKAQLQQARQQLDESKKQLDSVRDQVEQAKQALAAGYPLSDEALAQIAAYDQGMAQYQQGLSQLQSEEKKLADTERVLKANEKKLNRSQKEISANEKELADAEKTIAANEKKLADAKKQLDQARTEYKDGKKTAAEEIARGEKKIREAEKDIGDLERPEWYILDRNSNVSYARYKVDVEKVADIATVFPIFFFLVAALVSLTTMTRMVEEERIQIGTLKALGYNRKTIMAKYLIYCGAATVLGGALGLAGGFQLLPTVLYQAYATQYELPRLFLQFNLKYALISCGLEVLCTLGATWFACRRTLKEKPAALMVPRAPKAGKRILLERLPLIWKRLSFSYKATARNIFRYKKHLFMTIIGIAGCTALMVTGFGLQDSMSEIVNTQYKDIFKYDMKIELVEDKTDGVLDDFLAGKAHTKISSQSAEASSPADGEKISTTLYIPENDRAFSEFIALHQPRSDTPVSLDRDAVIMTEKMADALKLSKGDRFTLTNVDDKQAEFTLTAITENYVGCYLYMDQSVYQAAFGEFDYNAYLVRSQISGLAAQDEIAERLQDSEYVASSEFNSQSKESYENMMSSINLIVYVLILCAGALAVVVLYNLTNININERSRELATLRVLGYYHNEVARYIFREIGLLAILGTLVGLAAGFVLHRYVVLTAESPDFMMGREISPLSYLLSAVITLAFSILVDFLMVFKLRRIEMVESMKAVD